MDSRTEIARKASLHGYWVKRTILWLLEELVKAEMSLEEYRKWQASQNQPRPPRDDREHQEQAALFEWAALMESRLPELRLLFAIPNGGDRHPAVAAKLKAEGVRAGVWDVLLPVASQGYIGLWLEMKAGANSLTEEQIAWSRAMVIQGYALGICYEWMDAARQIVTYLGHDPADFGVGARQVREGHPSGK